MVLICMVLSRVVHRGDASSHVTSAKHAPRGVITVERCRHAAGFFATFRQLLLGVSVSGPPRILL